MLGLRTLHLACGLIALVIFLATGVFMTLQFPEAYRADEAVRYLYRASHVYILLIALVHMALGTYLTIATTRRAAVVQRVASALLLAAVPILILAFFVESPPASPERPLTLLGMIGALAGTVLHLGAGRR